VRDLYLLDPEWTHLNHGSFGACPRPVFEEYQRLQVELERQPTDFMLWQLSELLAESRTELAVFVGADPEGLLFVPNVTTGLNAVARSLQLGPGDEVLATDHEYGANDLMWSYLAARDGFDYVRRPFETEGDFWAGVSERTRVLFVSHITSATAKTFPVAGLAARAADAEIVSIVDGAHAPGQVDVDVEGVGADFYAGNCHKWRAHVGRMRQGMAPRRPPQADNSHEIRARRRRSPGGPKGRPQRQVGQALRQSRGQGPRDRRKTRELGGERTKAEGRLNVTPNMRAIS
jgi:isopenicillin-N epimerase